jgi:hypothetical protein
MSRKKDEAPRKNIEKLRQSEESIKQREEREAERLIQNDIDEIHREEDFSEYLDGIMDTGEDLEKFRILTGLSGLIHKDDTEIFYQTVFAQKRGHYTPIVLTSDGKVHPVKNQAKFLMETIKDDDGNPLFRKIKDVPEEERYQFFEKNGVRYKFNQRVFWDDTQNIRTVDNRAIHDVVNKKVYTKQIFVELKEIVTDYFYHMNLHEYDVISTVPVVSNVLHAIGHLFYLVLYGGMNAGKSTVLNLISFLEFCGYFTGKGTVASSCRNMHFLGIALNQDEFEKMSKDEKTMMVGVFNSGLNSWGRYTLSNMGIRDISKQALGLRTFAMKCFTCNDLTGFDPSFIDRLYVIQATRTNKKLKNINRPTYADLERFQQMRNKLFVYCLFNWKDIITDIDETKKELEKEGIFGRDTDKNSIILGIIKHFLGASHSKKVKRYIAEKAPVLQLEHTRTMEYTILDRIVTS